MSNNNAVIQNEVNSGGIGGRFFRPSADKIRGAIIVLGGSGGGLGWSGDVAANWVPKATQPWRWPISDGPGFRRSWLEFDWNTSLLPSAGCSARLRARRAPWQSLAHREGRSWRYSQHQSSLKYVWSWRLRLAPSYGDLTAELPALDGRHGPSEGWLCRRCDRPRPGGRRGRPLTSYRRGCPVPHGATLYCVLSRYKMWTRSRAAIPVEQIMGHVLLISGGDDQLWPSRQMGEAIIARLHAAGHPFEARHLSYDGAGHAVSILKTDDYPTLIRHRTTGLILSLGGSENANRKASASARAEALAFLGRHLEAESSERK